MTAGATPLSEDQLLLRLTNSPDVYPQKIELTRNVALLIELNLAAYRSASFLDDRILTPTTRGSFVSLEKLIPATDKVPNPRPLHFIFHAGHVGSTLVSRLLDEIPGVLSLREPLPLRSLADAYDVIGQSESLLDRPQFEALSRALLRLWSRGYDGTHSIIIKATSSASRVGASLLALNSSARALYLNLGAEPYLATLLAGQNSPIDLRGHGPSRMRRLQARMNAKPTPLYSMSIGEMAAMSWLIESWTQMDMTNALGSRLLSIDFDRFLTDLPAAMRQIVEHFALPADSHYFADVSKSPSLTRYSKAVEYEYSPTLRAQILAESRQRNRDELRKGMHWLETMAKVDEKVAKILNTRYG